MRPHLIVLPAKAIEGALLRRQGGAWGADGPGLERLVHAFVRAVLLGVRRQDALVLNTEPDPPDVELGEAVDRLGGERDAVVGANGAWQAISRKARSKAGRVPMVWTLRKLWQVSRNREC